MSQNTILAGIFDLCQRLWQGLQGYLTSGKDYKDKTCPCKEKQGTRIRFHPCSKDSLKTKYYPNLMGAAAAAASHPGLAADWSCLAIVTSVGQFHDGGDHFSAVGEAGVGLLWHHVPKLVGERRHHNSVDVEHCTILRLQSPVRELVGLLQLVQLKRRHGLHCALSVAHGIPDHVIKTKIMTATKMTVGEGEPPELHPGCGARGELFLL